MESNGIKLDSARSLAAHAVTVDDEAAKLVHLDQELRDLGIVHENPDDIWSSPVQLLSLLDSLGAPRSPYGAKGTLRKDRETGKQKYSTDGTALAWVAQQKPELAPLLERIHELKRIRSSAKYLSTLPDHVNPTTGRIHPVTGPADDGDERVGAITGRLGMKNPAGQQIPKDVSKDPYGIRSMFIAEDGCKLVAGDYTALEVVLLAHITKTEFGDTQLEEETAPGAPDFHAVNARRIFGGFLGWKDQKGCKISEREIPEFKTDAELKHLRDMVKSIWYGLMYGKGAQGFGETLKGIDGRRIGEEKAQELLHALFRSLPSLDKYQKSIRDKVQKYGGVESLDGRWCEVKHLSKNRKTFNMAYRRCLNFPMQAGGAAIAGRATIAAVKAHKLVLQVHDELVIEAGAETAAKEMENLRQIMVDSGSYYGLAVRLQVSTGMGDNWYECK